MSGRLYLGRGDVMRAGAMDWDLALDDVQEATRLLYRGEAEMVAETVLPLGIDPRAKAYGLPARLGGRFAAAGLKWTHHRASAPIGQEAITSTTLIDDLNTLMPLGMVEAALLTCIRTAAVSGHVLRALTPGIRRVAVLGAGRQAGMHLKMLQALFPDLAEITVWSRSGDVLNRLFPEGKIPPNIRLCETAETAVERADAVLMCTSSPQPILGAAAVRPGLLMLQIGFHEMSFDGIDAFDVVSCDLWGAFSKTSAKSLFQMHRAGRFEQTRVAADLPAILCEGWRPPKGASVYFSSFGLNIFDIALAARLLRHAATMGVGHHFPD